MRKIVFRDNEGNYLKACFALRRQGWSYHQLAKKFGKNHTTIIFHCHKHGVSKNGYRGNKIEKYIPCILEKICPMCKVVFETKMQIKKYCSFECNKKQHNNLYKLRKTKSLSKINEVEFGLDERNERVNLGLDYRDYLLRANGGNIKKVNKILYNAKGWAIIITPHKKMKEIIAERKKANEQRFQKLETS